MGFTESLPLRPVEERKVSVFSIKKEGRRWPRPTQDLHHDSTTLLEALIDPWNVEVGVGLGRH